VIVRPTDNLKNMSEISRKFSSSYRKLVGWQAAFAAVRRSYKPAPTEKQKQISVHPPLLTTHQAER
jgi:hypothetical protein